MITASAPGKVILFGEHAVVYDKLGIACSFDRRCNVTTSILDQDFISIKCKNLCLDGSMQKEHLFFFLDKVNDLINGRQFQQLNQILEENNLSPSFFVVASILKKYRFSGLKIEISSNIPKNLGSSSAVFSALTLSVISSLGKNVSKKEVSDFACLGDIIAHGGTPSGIDNNIVTYGGYLQYQKSKGVEMLDINFKIPLLIIDSGEKAKTGEMVSYVRNKREQSPERVNPILEALDDLSNKALVGLKNRDLSVVGKLMTGYYQKLKKLNISTEKLDQIIKIALNYNVLGAKPTGGWGGGCCLALMKKEEDLESLKEVFDKKGFHSFVGRIGVEGVKIIEK